MSSSFSRSSSSSEVLPTNNVLILGGWSPGPLNYLKHRFRHKCAFYEPPIPMPPVGLSWCIDPGFFALCFVVGFSIWAFYAVGRSSSYSKGMLILVRIALIAACVLGARLSVAWLVRGAIRRGANTALSHIRKDGIRLVIGFSWGGGVATELLRRGQIGGGSSSDYDHPSVLLLAPTTSVMASCAMQTDPVLQIRRIAAAAADNNDSGRSHSRVHVFHASSDGTFCPHPDRWDHTGANMYMCQDCHVFCERSSLQAIGDVMEDVLRTFELS